MRIVSWNIEWMNNWFVGGSQVAFRQSHTGIPNVADLATRVATVITEGAAYLSDGTAVEVVVN